MKKALMLVCLTASGLAWGQLPSGQPLSVYTIPGIANVAGRVNTRFVSDLAITNPGSSSADVVLSFVPEGSLEDQEISLSAGRTVVWQNVLQQLWGAAELSGAVLVTSDQPLLIRARTYNTASTGTFGVALPAVPDDGLLSAGDRASCLWISQSPDATKDFRTNISVAFPDAGGGEATVTLFDQAGSPAGQWEFSAEAADSQQVSAGKIVASLPVGRAEITVTAGRAAAYASVVDNVTGDSSLFPFEPLPVGVQDVLVSGVARADGKLGTFFRTDGRFYNPGTDDAAVQVAFHASQSSNPFPATAGFTVPAGKILDVTDVLGTLLGLPKGSSGALRFTSDSAVGILCRTSNVDPTGAKPGTFGAQQKPVPLLSFLSSADAGALVTGIRQNATYRTNIGFAAGSDGATYQLTLRSASGSPVTTVTRSLGSFGWEQPSIDKIFTSVPQNAQLLVKVTQGSVDVFDSSVDNGSGDSVVTPAGALPVLIPSSATIGPEGGSIQSDDGRLTIRIPAGALAVPSSVGITAGAGPYPDGIGPGYSLTVNGSAFAKPPIAVLRYSSQDLWGSAAEFLLLGQLSGGSIFALAGSMCDAPARTISAAIAGSMTSSQAAGRTPLVAFHIEIVRILSLKINPAKAGVLSGGTVIFKVTGFGQTVGTTELTPFSFDPGNTLWKRTGPDALGYVSGLGASATYTAPATVICVEEIEIIFQYFNPGRAEPYEAKASIQLLPRYWDLNAQADVKADYCGNYINNAVTFTLRTDQVSAILTLQDDLTFAPAHATHVETDGALSNVSFCPSKGCTVGWVLPPTPLMHFDLSLGGWSNGKFTFSTWGFVLNEDGFHDWITQASCPGQGTTTTTQLQPNCAGVPGFTKEPLIFDGPDPKNGCSARKTFSWREFQRWIKVTGKNFWTKSIYRIVLQPHA